ncbi:helix-turn-helix domain-containing protein [Sphingobacterium sp. Lzh-3]|uniref:helix-turn-helix domain-containing protein n=1 Tax=Sphingobacterium sp. Lzh-3 TaxID=3382150 RepID=UPI00398CD0E8
MQLRTSILNGPDQNVDVKDHIVYLPLFGASAAEEFQSSDAYVFFFFEKGDGLHSIDYLDYPVKSSEVHITFPNQVQSWIFQTDCIGHRLIVSNAFIAQLMNEADQFNYATNKFPVIKVSNFDFKDLVANLKVIARELARPQINWQIVNLRVRLILLILNAKISAELHSSKKTSNSNIITIADNFKALLNKHIRETRSVHFYSDELFVSANYLGILCKRIFGKSAKTIINERLLLEAKRLLLGTNYSVKEIAYKLGFTDMANFSSFIKHMTGNSPKEIRQQQAESNGPAQSQLVSE